MSAEPIVTPAWIAAVRQQYGLDTRTPFEAGLAWEHHGLLAGAVTALGYALDRVEALEKDRERLDWLETLLTEHSRIEITHHRVNDHKQRGHFASIGKLIDIDERESDGTHGFGYGVRAAIDDARTPTTETDHG